MENEVRREADNEQGSLRILSQRTHIVSFLRRRGDRFYLLFTTERSAREAIFPGMKRPNGVPNGEVK
jgi:hypothetical protein